MTSLLLRVFGLERKAEVHRDVSLKERGIVINREVVNREADFVVFPTFGNGFLSDSEIIYFGQNRAVMEVPSQTFYRVVVQGNVHGKLIFKGPGSRYADLYGAVEVGGEVTISYRPRIIFPDEILDITAHRDTLPLTLKIA